MMMYVTVTTYIHVVQERRNLKLGCLVLIGSFDDPPQTYTSSSPELIPIELQRKLLLFTQVGGPSSKRAITQAQVKLAFAFTRRRGNTLSTEWLVSYSENEARQCAEWHDLLGKDARSSRHDRSRWYKFSWRGFPMTKIIGLSRSKLLEPWNRDRGTKKIAV